MILVDTSVWIELLSAKRPRDVKEEDLLNFATCGPVLQELLQGLKPGAPSDAFREMLLAVPVLSDPVSLELYLEAADIYRQGRRRGLTVRSSVDCLIAAIAIENGVPVWHRDRDFSLIARYTALETASAR
ncbi:MAG TPA: PIN domain-containing protein [Bryobacteraceae bacterium]|nr:PIN domain-containing protein [Bryobacteraceae bacterium]